MRQRFTLLASVLWLSLNGVGLAAQATDTPPAGPMALTLNSPAFTDGEPIPAQYTCDGTNVSPPLAWTEPPAGTKSFAVVIEDTDAPQQTPFVHWIVYNLPAKTRLLQEAFAPNESLADGTRQGLTDFGMTGYGGPCPPTGTHRYVFKLSAVDTILDLPRRAALNELTQAISGHLLAQTQLVGTYQRKDR